MLRFSATIVILSAITACATAPDPAGCEPSVANGLWIRVVDEAGRPVAGAEVRAPGGKVDWTFVSDYAIAGAIGRVEAFGAVRKTDERGEVCVPSWADDEYVVARRGDAWGASAPSDDALGARTIVLACDESIPLACADRDGRPGVGAIVWVGVGDTEEQARTGGETVWGARVTAADGTFSLPHAQHWRALQRAGRHVAIAAVVLWSDEETAYVPRPFPAENALQRFEVASSGWIDVELDPGTRIDADLRWLDSPYEGETPDDVPEFPIALPAGPPFSVPLGRKLAIAIEVPGFLDPVVEFDGPRRPGERVVVRIADPEPAARVTGRFVDEQGLALAGREFRAWLERDGVRIDPEREWLVSEADGRFGLDLPPGAGGMLHVRLTGSSSDARSESHVRIGGDRPVSKETLVELEGDLSAGENGVGDVVLRPLL